MNNLSRSLVFAALLASQAAYAQTTTLEKPDCTGATIAGIDEKIGKMKDGPQKTTAATEIATAKDMQAKGKIDDCQTALLKATLQTK